MKTLVADIETDDLLPQVSRLWCLGVKDADTGESQVFTDYSNNYPSISEGLAWLAEADRMVFHNGFRFDILALRKLGYKQLDPLKLYDTLVASRLQDPNRQVHSLKALGEMVGVFKKEWDDWSGFSEGMADYLYADLDAGDAVYQYLVKKLEGWGESVELEMRVAWIIAQQIENGFCLDIEKAEALAADLMIQKADIEDKLREVFKPVFVKVEEKEVKRTRRAKHPFLVHPDGTPIKELYAEGAQYTKIKLQEFNPGSRQQIAKRLIGRYGWKPKKFTPSGEPEISEPILKDLKYPEAEILVDYLVTDKKLGMLTSPIKKDGSGGGWLHHVRNGRVHGDVNTLGAVTGRMTHSKPNVAQADGDPRMRSLWIPKVGWVLVGCDADGLELRMLGHYLARYDKGKFLRAVVEGRKEDGTDAHSINQRVAGLWSRDSAKTLIYALIYGAGDVKLGKIVIEDAYAAGKPKPKGSLKKIGADVRARLMKGITGLDKLVKRVKFKAKRHGYLIGLDGRRVYVRSEHAALNTLLQSAGAIVMKKALVLYDDWATKTFGPHGSLWAYCANVHDEVQQEVHPSIAEQAGRGFKQAIIDAGIALGVRCPLDGAFDIGKNWSETH